jgi:hypothetical protein
MDEKSSVHTAVGALKKGTTEGGFRDLTATGPMKPEPMEGVLFGLIPDGLGNREGMVEGLFGPTIGLGNKVTMGVKSPSLTIGPGRKEKMDAK